MTPWMASTASAGALKSGESETTPPIIARLRNVTYPPPGQQSEEDGERKLKYLRELRHPILGESDTEVLFHSSNEYMYFISAKYRTRVLDDGEEEFKREQLGTQLMGPAGM